MLNKNKNIIVEQVDAEFVLFNAENNSIFILNSTAYELWNRCLNCRKEEIIQSFTSILDRESVGQVGISTIIQECEHMIDSFILNGLIGDHDA